MRIIVTFFYFLLFLANPLFAQEYENTFLEDESGLRFGVFAAPTISWMKPTANKSTDGDYRMNSNGSQIGFMYGLIAEYHFAKNYAFVTGLQVNMTGGSILSESNKIQSTLPYVNSADFKYHLQYLELPISLKMSTYLSNRVKFYGLLGITPAFNIKKNVSYNVIFVDEDGNTFNESDEKVRLQGTLSIAPVLIQMNIGTGIEYKLNDQLNAHVGVFFNNGFAPDVTNPVKYQLPYNVPFKDGNIRLNSLSLRIGLFF